MRALLSFAVAASVASVVTLAACSSAPSSEEPSGGDAAVIDPPSDAIALDGEYMTSDDGEIADITFADGTSYVMWPQTCPARGSCLQLGTYALNADASEITLTDDVTGAATTLPFQALAVASSDDTVADSLHLDALTTDAGATLVAHDAGVLAKDAGALTKDAGALTKSTVTSAKVGTQTVKLVTPVAKLLSSSNDDCAMSLPVSGDAATFLATAKKAIVAKGGTLSGTTSAGSFTVPAPFGTVSGTYAVANGAAQLKIAPASLGFLQTCEAVYDALKSALGT